MPTKTGKTSWNQGSGSVWGESVERLPDLDPSEVVRGKYSHQIAPNLHRHRIIKILRTYGPLTCGDITRKDTGDMSSSRGRQNQRYYSALRFMEDHNHVFRTGPHMTLWAIHDVPASTSVADVESWLDQ